MDHLQLPIFVRLNDCGDVVRYDSIAKMQYDFEQIDVENGEYDAWDAVGTPLKLSVQASDEWLRIEASPNSKSAQLADAITEFALLQGIYVDPERSLEGDFTAALEQISSAVQTKRQPMTWWQRFRGRF
jgi:hypothetical protein